MPTTLPFFWIDAFTQTLGKGNPAGVVPLDTWPEDALLQLIAFENGLSETAFFVRTGPARFHLRWFTPAVEVDLCGHATLAAAAVLYSELGESAPLLTFDSRSGPLTVARAPEGRLELDFPARASVLTDGNPALVEALGGTPVEIYRNDVTWLILYRTEDEVRQLQPDHQKLKTFLPGRMIVSAPGKDTDFVSRFFAPDAGVPEDPVTGSAHCTLVPYWAARLRKTTLTARQVSARSGELWLQAEGPRVKIAGHTKLYLKGQLHC